MNNFQAIIEDAWTLASVGAVLLCLWVFPRAYRVCRDARADLRAIENSPDRDSQHSFAKLEARIAWWIVCGHCGVLVHQVLFLLVGLYALWEKNEPLAVGTPLMEYIGVPVVMLVAQYVIVFVQVCLVVVSTLQERWRIASLRDTPKV